MTWNTPTLHALLGGLVLAMGAFLMWDQLHPLWILLLAGLATAGLWWQGRRIGRIWAWATMGLGIESMAWPIMTMIQVRLAGNEPTGEQMGAILNAVLFGLFSSVFWVTFAFGLFKRAREQDAPPPTQTPATVTSKPARRKASRPAR